MATGRVPTTANSPLTAKGDLFTYSTAPARLAVGNDGETIVADSSTSTGLRYQATMAGGKNCLINGGFDIWQRGTTFNSIANFTADRWVVFPAAGTLNATQSTDVPTSPYFNYSLQVAGVSSSGDIIRQRIESAQSTPLAGQTVTLSVYAKSTAGTAALKWNTNVPSATDNFTTTVQDQSGTFSASPAGTWTRYTATFAVSANAVRGYELRIFRDSATSSNTTLYAGVQLEIGSVATQFTRAGGTIQGELAACQRYGWSTNVLSTNNILYANGSLGTTTRADFLWANPVPLRAAATSITATSSQVYNQAGASGPFSGGTWAIAQAGNAATYITYTHGSSMGSTGQVVWATSSAATGFIFISAEL
jgi:hypothetical protein